MKNTRNVKTGKPPVFVTRPTLPPFKEYADYLKKIWESRWLTNNGRFHQEFEHALVRYLGVPHVSLYSNGTLALLGALKTLNVQGEVITSPYTFVATVHALSFLGLKPVFCDIEKRHKTMDPKKVERLITRKTSAILAIHVHGFPCQVEALDRLGKKHGLKVIYDAAHAFGITLKGRSILDWGDASVLSFHATKVFTTLEGGAAIFSDPVLNKRSELFKNFGIEDEDTIRSVGINAKMNEAEAAMGILQLKYLQENIRGRRKVYQAYMRELSGIEGLEIPTFPPGYRYNYSYFPIYVNETAFGMTRDALFQVLRDENIICRKYFYPLISNILPYRSLASAGISKLPEANYAAETVLCLPIYPDLDISIVKRICRLILKTNK
jgi:dTDP-4-amino-4,6-dideoxygalactose transaminase